MVTWAQDECKQQICLIFELFMNKLVETKVIICTNSFVYINMNEHSQVTALEIINTKLY